METLEVFGLALELLSGFGSWVSHLMVPELEQRSANVTEIPLCRRGAPAENFELFTEESFAFRFPLTPASSSSSSIKLDLLAQAGRGRAHPGTTCRLRSESRRRGTFEKSWSENAES